MFRFLVIISLILLVLMLAGRFLRRLTASFLSSAARHQSKEKSPGQEVIYSSEEVVVLRGESKRNIDEENRK